MAIQDDGTNNMPIVFKPFISTSIPARAVQLRRSQPRDWLLLQFKKLPVPLLSQSTPH